MPKSIAVFGVGPGLGQAVAHRYAREGYDIVLVARRQESLDKLANELASAGATAHVITADLSHTEATPQLAEQIRGKVGELGSATTCSPCMPKSPTTASTSACSTSAPRSRTPRSTPG